MDKDTIFFLLLIFPVMLLVKVLWNLIMLYMPDGRLMPFTKREEFELLQEKLRGLSHSHRRLMDYLKLEEVSRSWSSRTYIEPRKEEGDNHAD